MKKFHSLGELLLDFRTENKLSQFDLASLLEVDTRTVQRWEKDQTLVHPDKEKVLAEQTLLPYQLIRNLNAAVPIPTFYDFRIRKYALSKLNNELPKAKWLRESAAEFSSQVRVIDPFNDYSILERDLKIQKLNRAPLSVQMVQKAVRILPELNLIIMDKFKNYSGHALVLPLSKESYKALYQQEISIDELSSEDLVNYRELDEPIFLNYDITADCNDHYFFLAHHYVKFFEGLDHLKYTFCSHTMRFDSYALNEQLQLKLIWEKEVEHDQLGLAYHPRFYSGTLCEFLRME